jgi:hypothetical protein
MSGRLLLDLALVFLRPRKKGMRLDVGMKRLSAPYPRNVHKKHSYPPNSAVLRDILGFS